MTIMLAAMFAAVGLGLVSKEFGRREVYGCAAIAGALTLIYFFRPMLMT